MLKYGFSDAVPKRIVREHIHRLDEVLMYKMSLEEKDKKIKQLQKEINNMEQK